mmetsp:Transcript_22693/g.52934  ORF Transcript_22693/g.52934 Transcript_22693/m.52934 type:complete len:184 (+) Transcript_22693:13-564(+)|eukprot:CAMPEP_0114563748 /NCGR_PEP_ID=MMETSP0114-20121206/13298_1 /TAXON_ID=31324 /ORGANISM="Goniomonas sp, Strain m" /LENGTH=183 /DNA_ID=CAMNT_0001749661 /DNA_START=14 /DNA_END=565 /DNA_ORIENTATION=+
MLKLLTLKDEQKKKAAAESSGTGGGRATVVSAAKRRLQKDLSAENLEKNMWCELSFPDPNDLMNFLVVIKPDEGYWKGGRFDFKFEIAADYPHAAPKVLCTTRVYHPNIDTDGKVCLNILREDWRPVLDINVVINGLLFLFLEPNPEDPLNKEAAELLRTNKSAFAQTVQRSMRGGAAQPRRW